MSKESIDQIICPHCKKNKLYRKISFIGNRISLKKKKTWRCPDCVFIFDDTWFNKFHQFEDLVLRKGEDKELWEEQLR